MSFRNDTRGLRQVLGAVRRSYRVEVRGRYILVFVPWETGLESVVIPRGLKGFPYQLKIEWEDTHSKKNKQVFLHYHESGGRFRRVERRGENGLNSYIVDIRQDVITVVAGGGKTRVFRNVIRQHDGEIWIELEGHSMPREGFKSACDRAKKLLTPSEGTRPIAA